MKEESPGASFGECQLLILLSAGMVFILSSICEIVLEPLPSEHSLIKTLDLGVASGGLLLRNVGHRECLEQLHRLRAHELYAIHSHVRVLKTVPIAQGAWWVMPRSRENSYARTVVQTSTR